MKLNLFACKRSNEYSGGLIVVAAHDIDEAYKLYEKYGFEKLLIEYYYINSELEITNKYSRRGWYQIPDITVECDSPRVIDEDGYSE